MIFKILGSGAGLAIVSIIVSRLLPNKKLNSIGLKMASARNRIVDSIGVSLFILGKRISSLGRSKFGQKLYEWMESTIQNSISQILMVYYDNLSVNGYKIKDVVFKIKDKNVKDAVIRVFPLRFWVYKLWQGLDWDDRPHIPLRSPSDKK